MKPLMTVFAILTTTLTVLAAEKMTVRLPYDQIPSAIDVIDVQTYDQSFVKAVCEVASESRYDRISEMNLNEQNATRSQILDACQKDDIGNLISEIKAAQMTRFIMRGCGEPHLHHFQGRTRQILGEKVQCQIVSCYKLTQASKTLAENGIKSLAAIDLQDQLGWCTMWSVDQK